MSTNNNVAQSPTTSTSCKPNSSSSKKSAQLDDRTRLKRNAGEKKRRDKLNNYISELSAMVPSCRMPQSQRKLDKSTILKLTVSYMKLHADLLPESVDESAMNWKPSFLSNEELGQLMLEALDGFLFVIWSTGRTIYVSESITPLLGHLQQELMGKNFLELIHPEDVPMVRDRMFPHQSESGYIEDLSTPSPEPISSPSSTISDSPTFLRRNFVMRMCRGGFASSKTEYEMVSCSGHLRRWNEVTRNSPVDTTDMLPLDGYCLVGVGRLQCSQTIREMTPSGPSLNAWTSHHSLDAKYIHIDQNASPILGYTAAELLGSNGYNFYHDEDLNGLARCHVDLTKSGTGDTSLYRFLTKGQQWLWIKTRGVVKYQEGTKQPTSIICHNIVASYAEVWQYLQNKTRQYGPKERRLMAAPPPDVARTVAASTKTEQTSPHNDIKVEQFSPQSVQCPDATYAMYYAPSGTPSPRKEEATPLLLTPSPQGGATSQQPPSTIPNFIAFTTTEYMQPTGGGGGGGTFSELFPNYRASISTEETHGKYKAPSHMNTAIPQPKLQPQSAQQPGPSQFTPREYVDDVKPVYMATPLPPRQPSFMETMTSATTPPPAADTKPCSIPVQINTPSPQNNFQSNIQTPPNNIQLPKNNIHTPTSNLYTSTSNLHSTTNTVAPNILATASHPANIQPANLPSNIIHIPQHNVTHSNTVPSNTAQSNLCGTVSETPNVLVTTPANVVVMGQPAYVGNYMTNSRDLHQVPNVTVRSMALKSEEPVVGMPVNSGFSHNAPVTSATFVQHIPASTVGYSQPVVSTPTTYNHQVSPAVHAVFNQPVTSAHNFHQQSTTNGTHHVRMTHINSPLQGTVKQQQQQQQQPVPHELNNFAKKAGFAPEKRAASPATPLNSCAQMSMKRMRNDSPNTPAPQFGKPVPHGAQHFNGGQYASYVTVGGSIPQTNGYHHPGGMVSSGVVSGRVVSGVVVSGNMKPPPLVVGAANSHIMEPQDNTGYQSIDTGQQHVVYKPT